MNEWFNEYGWLQKAIPKEAWEACSAPGRNDEAVEYWVHELQFSIPPRLITMAKAGRGTASISVTRSQGRVIMRKKLYFMVIKNGRIERSKNPFPKKLNRDGGPHNLFPVYRGELFTPKEMIKIDLLDDWYVSVEIDPQETFIGAGSRFPFYPLEV